MQIDVNLLKNQLTLEQVIEIVTKGLGSDGYEQGTKDSSIRFQTVCHNYDHEGSYKLYYYPESHSFHCYTECGDSFDIYELVRRHFQLQSFSEAVRYVTTFFQIPDFKRGFEAEPPELIGDWDIINQYDAITAAPPISAVTPILYENLLKYFGPYAAPTEWMAEGIKPEVMRKFGIRIDAGMQKVIIPHRDIKGNLIGIRGRSFNPMEVADGKKYMPAFIEGTMYNHPLGDHLYGLYENLSTIKELGKIAILESEKSVMQASSYYDKNFCVACCGSSVSQRQVDLILSLGVNEVILMFDRENDTDPNSELTKRYEDKIFKIAQKMTPYMNVYVVFDYEGILKYKNSPTDQGKETLEYLMSKKMLVPSSWENWNKKGKKQC